MAATQDGGIGRWLFTKEVWDGIPCGDGYFFVFSMMFSWSVSLNYFHNWRQWEEEEQKISRNQLISWVSRHWNMPRKRLTNEQHRYDGMIVIFSVTCHHIVTLSLTCLWPQVLRERRMLVPKPLSLSQVPWRFLKYCGVTIAVKKTLLKQKQRNACRTQKTSKLLFLLFPKNALRYSQLNDDMDCANSDFFPMQGSQLVIFYAQKLLELCVLIWTWSWEHAYSIDSASTMFQFLVFAKTFYVFYMMFHCFTMSYCTCWKLASQIKTAGFRFR